MNRTLALLLAAIMCLGMFAGCTGTGDKAPASTDNGTGTTAPVEQREQNLTPLVVGYSAFNEKFSPFFAESAYDQDVMEPVSYTHLLKIIEKVYTNPFIFDTICNVTVSYTHLDVYKRQARTCSARRIRSSRYRSICCLLRSSVCTTPTVTTRRRYRTSSTAHLSAATSVRSHC